MTVTEKTLQKEESISDQESTKIPTHPQIENPNEITRVTKSKAKRTILLASLFCGMFLAVVSATAIGPLLGLLAYDLNDTKNMSWYLTSFALVSAVFQVLGVRISDCLGRRRVLLFSAVSNLIILVIMGFATSSNMLIALRALQGCTSGLIQTVTSAVLIDMFDIEARIRYQPYLALAVVSGFIVGPVLGSILAVKLSWRYDFWIIAICYIPVIIGYYLLVRIPTAPEQTLSKENLKKFVKRIDPIGCLLISTGISLFLLGMNLASTSSMYSWSSPIVIGFLAGCVILLLVFLAFEKYVTSHPLFPSTMIVDINLILCYVQQFVCGWAGGLPDILLYILYQSVYNATIIESSLRLIGPMVVNIIFSFIGSKITHKVGHPKYTNIAGAMINALSAIFLVTVLKSDSNIGVQIGILIIFQAGAGLFSPSIAICTQLVLEKKEPHLVSSAMSLGRFFMFCGLTVSAAFSLSLLQYQTKADMNMLQHNDPDTYHAIMATNAGYDYTIIKNLPPGNIQQTLNTMYFENIRNIMFSNVFWGFINTLCAIFMKIPENGEYTLKKPAP